MLEQLESIKTRFEEVTQSLNDPKIINDIKHYTALNKEYKNLNKIVEKYENYQFVLSEIEESKRILNEESDAELRELAKEELADLEPRKYTLEEKLKVMLIPKDPNDSRNVIVELRAGTGGDEACLFVGDLFRMYSRFSENMHWKMNIMDVTEGTTGGYKELIFKVKGEDVYGKLKYESGVHRVQRVPATESQGRVHTSAASAVVLPEAQEIDVEINMNDIKKDTFCSSGPGGQSVNTTYSAIRVTHIPSGVVAQCQDEKSQIRNLEKALEVLRSRLYQIELDKQNEEVGLTRRGMIGTGDRSQKIRTYNFPQGRVTDHRINLTTYNLSNTLDGRIEEFIEKLRIADNTEKMKSGEGIQS